MEMINQIAISSPDVGRFYSFIYCIYFLNDEGVVYIGETNAKNGPLGRLSGHMQRESGTFYKRCLEEASIDIDRISDTIHMLTFNLQDYPAFCGDANKSNRMALEYFVHTKMEEYSVDDHTTTPFNVISHVKIANRNVTNIEFQRIAEIIARSFFEMMPFELAT